MWAENIGWINLDPNDSDPNTGIAKEFTAKYDVLKLVYYEKHKSLEEAVKREKQLKKWRRQWKMAFIEKENHKWQDLSSEIINTGSPVAKPK